MYAQELHPWAAWGLKVTLDRVDPTAFAQSSKKFLATLRESVQSQYDSTCDRHGGGLNVHSFRIRRGECPSCETSVAFYPYSLVTVTSRSLKERFGFFGCRKCGKASRHKLSAETPRCSHCRFPLSHPRRPLVRDKRTRCPHCRRLTLIENAWAEGTWELVLVQRLCQEGGKERQHVEVPNSMDRRAAGVRYGSNLPPALLQGIPEGIETARLTAAGFGRWADLYPPRQLNTLLSAHQILDDEVEEGPIAERIRLCLFGAAEMAGHLCRWDRFNPKIFEALSNHRYSFNGLAVEQNTVSPIGRGTLDRRLRSSLRALRWADGNFLHYSKVSYRTGPKNPRALGMDGNRITIVQGTSETQAPADRTVSLVLTDPPYLDSIQYTELAELFLVWMRAFLGPVQSLGFDWNSEAVPNRVRGTTIGDYRERLATIFSECVRTLTPRGKVVLTFHNTNFRAWAALGAALNQAGLRIAALAVTQAENPRDHSKRDRDGFAMDLVVECQPEGGDMIPIIITNPRTPEERELIRVGQTIAMMGGQGYEKMKKDFLARTARMRSKKIEVPIEFETHSTEAS